jgi:hypothetical protein
MTSFSRQVNFNTDGEAQQGGLPHNLITPGKIKNGSPQLDTQASQLPLTPDWWRGAIP